MRMGAKCSELLDIGNILFDELCHRIQDQSALQLFQEGVGERLKELAK